jgi:hypothetical protein
MSTMSTSGEGRMMSGAATEAAVAEQTRPDNRKQTEEATRPRLGAIAWWQQDGIAVALLALIAVATAAWSLRDIGRFIRGDWPTAFLPWYAYLGVRLRAFDIPGWNPYQFSGSPFIGDPSSGWMYLPAMLAYALLPALPATALFIAGHVVLSALAAYGLARLTGLGVSGAFVAGIAYAVPWLIFATSGMVLMFQVTTWLPVALIGVELARGPGTAVRRFGGLVLSGLAICQILAAWLGQGSYYALLLIGGWVAWRTLAAPPRGWSARQRIAGCIGIGLGILVIGVALNAAALLPRLDANARSNAPGGIYSGISGWIESRGGAPLALTARSLGGGFMEANWQYVGAAVIALALLAPFLALRWPPLIFWIAAPVVAIILLLPEQNLLKDAAFAAFPRFEALHLHLPERILLIVPLAASMLAGASVDALTHIPARVGWRSLLPMAAAVAIVGGAFALSQQGLLTRSAFITVLAASLVAGAAFVLPATWRAPLLPLALGAMILWDPTGRLLLAAPGPGAAPDRSLHAAVDGQVEAFLDHNGAAAFLHDATRDAPGRYAGFDPAALPDLDQTSDLPPQAYRNHWLGSTNWLLVLNWGSWFDLEDAQGYNPISIRRYGEYIDALNGHRQEYHEADIFPAGLRSPLLDLLNVRYLIVPADRAGQPELTKLLKAMPVVYQDQQVQIVENPAAYPRAWLVHQAQKATNDEILPLLSSGTIDPSTVAVLEGAAPPLATPPSPAQETVHYTRLSPEHFSVAVSTQAPALLMLSEIWDPGWTATVNGAPAAISRADYIFQAIPVPAGTSVVDVRYIPPYLNLGLAMTTGSAVLLALVAIWLFARERRSASLFGDDADATSTGDALSAVLAEEQRPAANSFVIASRRVALGSALAIVAIPIALIAATWEPLDPPPRGSRAAVADQFSPAGASSSDRDTSKGRPKNRKRDKEKRNKDNQREAKQKQRDKGQNASAAIATPDGNVPGSV